MKRLILVLILLVRVAYGQSDTLSFFHCLELLESNFPKVKDKEFLNRSAELKDGIIKSSWYPKLDINGKATYQSDVVGLDINVPGLNIPSAAKDQYKVTLDVSQVIYDGGRIKANRDLEAKSNAVNVKNVDVELYKYKELVNQLYFSVLILQKQKELLNSMYEDLQIRRKSLKAGVDNGVLLKSELLAFDAEILIVEQQLQELENKRVASLKAMNNFLNADFSLDAVLTIPSVELSEDAGFSRHEYELFSLSKDQLEASKRVVSKDRMPQVYAFAQLGYGKPGLNMMSDEFDSFYILGAGLSWNIWDWKKNKKNKQVLTIKANMVDIQRESFDRQLSVSINQELANLKSSEEALEKDLQIIMLREEITKAAKVKLDNGTITSADYISDLNNEIQAKINYETHKTEYVKAMVDVKYLRGEF